MKTQDPTTKLKALIKEHGSQAAVARLLGVSDPYLSDLVLGRRPFSERMLTKLGLKRVVVAA